MFRKFTIYISSIILTTTVLYFAAAQENSGFKVKLIQLFNNSSGNNEAVEKKTADVVSPPSDEKSSGESGEIFFKKGEWSEYVTDPEYNERMPKLREGNVYSDDVVNINTTGSVKINLNYGKSYFTDSKYKQYAGDEPKSKVINSGFMPEQTILLHMDGTIGDRITVYIDHDSRRQDDQNHYLMNYRAINDDEVIREINAGEIDVKFNHSKYAVYDSTDAKALGVDFTVRKGDLSLKAFGSVARGETTVEYFRGNSSPGSTKIAEYQYVRKTYYQLEPFIRYDGVTTMPSGSAAYSLITLTSDLSSLSDPSAYVVQSVNILPAGFELYIDDQNQYNNNNAIQLSLDGGYYTKMVNGTDYSINYATGVIHFLTDIPENSRIFAVYKRNGGTLDPCAVSPEESKHPGGSFTGKIFVFIKYGYSIDEDTVTKNLTLDAGETDKNNDGKVNLDVYEIRSVYYLGARQILSSDFSLNFYNENQAMTDNEKTKLGRYKLELTGGNVLFYTREPFRSLLALISSDRPAKIYSEMKKADAYLYSRYRMLSEYSAEARSFRLKHGNIIEKSVMVKINEKPISESRYSVDYNSGYISFTDPNNPVISSGTRIEIKYEYLPYGSTSEKFIGGLRADYDVNKILRIGGSLVLSKDGSTKVVPDIGKESEQTLMFEGDASLKLSQNKMADFYNLFAKRKRNSIPVEFSAYAEYAKSYRDVNTFGKALIDNMETSDEIVSISLTERDWILSSMPPSLTTTQTDRGLLNYYLYRNPESPDTLKGTGFTPYSVSYSVKPGPFNIAMGHIADSITSQDQQKSLVFDFNFSTGNVVTAVTRKLSDSAVDLSGIQYIEVWVKYEAGSGDSVDFYMDLGSINEDSDGDGVLDTEDVNKNGYIDSTPSSGYSEDRGFTFNPTGGTATKVGSGAGLSNSTLGDGILTSEDLNGNGVLDTTDNVYTVKLGSTTGSATLTPNGGAWQKIRVYMSTLTQAQVLTLQETNSIRLYLKKNSGTTGRVSIDSLRVVSSKWKNPELDGSAIDNSDRIKITMVNSINDSDYRADSFLIRQKGTYESLYGSSSTDDIDSESETALQIDYNIPASNSNVSIKRKFSKEIDIRFYKTMNIWFNARSINAANVIGFILGSSDSDYIEYRYTPDYTLLWREIMLKLSDNSGGSIEKYKVTGSPDLKRIKYIKAVIYGSNTTGSIWLNEIYVSEPEKLSGSAHWYEFELKTMKPLFKTASGVPVLSDMNIKYIFKGHSSQFSSVNKTTSDIKENYHEVSTSARILPNWNASLSYTNEKSSTDSLNEEVVDTKKGDARRDLFTFNTAYNSTGKNIPTITFAYTMDKNDNLIKAETDGNKYNQETEKVVHTPVLSYQQEIADFLYGKMSFKMMLDMVFTHNKINRDSVLADDTVLSASVALKEQEKRQESKTKVEMDYSNGLFFIRPAMDTSSKEIVDIEGYDSYDKTGVSGTLIGGYHLPFTHSNSLKFLERNNGAGVVLGLKFIEYCIPEYSMNFDYKENGFKDYEDDHAVGEGYNRSKNSISSINTGIKIPVILNRTELFKKIKHLQFNYNRSVYFTETDVPYEGEGTDMFNEEFGISNVLSGISPLVYNLIGNYPGIYFKGRGNAAGGREIVYGTFNDYHGIKDICSSNEYGNSLKLTDKFTTDLSVDLDSFTFSVSGSLSQVCERSNIYGIPNQVIIADSGINFEFDLMKIFNFGFFKNHGDNLFYHSSTLSLGLNFTDNMLITSNINEKVVSPQFGFVLKWDRSSLGFKYEFNYRKKNNYDYISTDLVEGDSDYIYLENMEGNKEFKEQDYGNKFSTLYETDVLWLYNFFSNFYKLTGNPIFSIEYRMEINRYDYFVSVSPEPYDLFMLTSKLKLDLHKNIQGGFSGTMALEKYRNRDDNSVSNEVKSYDISASISFIF